MNLKGNKKLGIVVLGGHSMDRDSIKENESVGIRDKGR